MKAKDAYPAKASESSYGQANGAEASRQRIELDEILGTNIVPFETKEATFNYPSLSATRAELGPAANAARREGTRSISALKLARQALSSHSLLRA
jgi:hypothetical protein